MDRAISSSELKVVNWLLDHALVDVTAYPEVQAGASTGASFNRELLDGLITAI
jgi:hypothetical protein